MRILVAALASAVALFFLGFVWWGLLMSPAGSTKTITDETLVAKMSDSLDESAVYFYPDPGSKPSDPASPMAILYFNTEMPPMGPMMGMGFAHMFLVALLVSMFVSSRKLPTFAERLKLVAFLGLFVALWADVGNMIWWHHPPGWAAFHFGYDFLSWLLAGSIIAAIVKPDADAHAAERDAATAQ